MSRKYNGHGYIGYLQPENRTLEACANCGGLMIKKNFNQLYCSRKCTRRVSYLNHKAKMVEKQDKLPFRFCENCKVVIGKNRHMRWCRKCAPEMYKISHRTPRNKERRELHLMRSEYHYLLANANTLGKRDFIRLLSIAEMLGRDLEEWVSENEHLRWLQAGMQEEQRQFDAGEKRKANPNADGIPIQRTNMYCRCPECKARRLMREQKRGDISEGTEGGNPVSGSSGSEGAERDNQQLQSDKETGAGCDAGCVAEPDSQKKKEEKVK